MTVLRRYTKSIPLESQRGRCPSVALIPSQGHFSSSLSFSPFAASGFLYSRPTDTSVYVSPTMALNMNTSMTSAPIDSHLPSNLSRSVTQTDSYTRNPTKCVFLFDYDSANSA